MYFVNEDILQTPAECIVVPVSLKGKKTRAQTTMERLFADYVEDIKSDIERGMLTDNIPSCYIPPPGESKKLILNFPIEAPTTTNYTGFINTLRCMFDKAADWKIISLAVGDFENGVPWSVVESCLMNMEASRGDVEIWLYPPPESEEKNEPLICSAV